MTQEGQEQQAIYDIIAANERQYDIFDAKHVEKMVQAIHNKLSELRKPSEDLVQKIINTFDDWMEFDENNIFSNPKEVATEIAQLIPSCRSLGNDAIQLIADERKRQIEDEGFTPKHDDDVNNNESIGNAAACYAMSKNTRFIQSNDEYVLDTVWPWRSIWWKPTPDNRIRELVKAGALIVAEIERLQRDKTQKNK